MTDVMKRLLLLCSCLMALSICSYADNVTYSRAKKVAESFLQRIDAGTRVEPVQNALTKSYSEGLYYIFNSTDGSGFVIVAADDAVKPVLAYSDEGCFDPDNVPDAAREWLDELGASIMKAAGSKAAPSSAITGEWQRLEGPRTKADAVGQHVLETAKWDQGFPYNGFCPMVDGKRTITGCVATATAILMRYHQWPMRGSGTLPNARTEKGSVVEGHEINYDYKWDLMPLKYNGSETREQRDAVAQLMLDAGLMASMEYGLGSSGGHTDGAANGLSRYMDYDRSIVALSYNSGIYLTPESWYRRIAEEIDRDQPVLYTATARDRKSSHCFIIDGYDSEGRIHVNFGWGGSSDGFYAFPDLGEFPYDHTMWTNIRRPDSTAPEIQFPVYYNGIMAHEDNTVEVNLWQEAYSPVDITIAVGKIGVDGKLLGIVSEERHISGNKMALYRTEFFSDVAVPASHQTGEGFAPFFKDYETGEWTPLPYCYGGASSNHYYAFDDKSVLEENSWLEYHPEDNMVTITTFPEARVLLDEDVEIENVDGSASFNPSGLITYDPHLVTILYGAIQIRFYLSL